MGIMQRLNVRVPSIDVACRGVQATPTQMVAHLGVRPAVRCLQPVAPCLASGGGAMPETAEMFALDGYFARTRPTICVLPQLATAEITHFFFSEGLPMHRTP